MSRSALIVDDSITVRMDLKEAFEGAGFEAYLSATLAEARDALRRRSFDVLVLDVLLPDGDGIDLLAEVRLDPATSDLAVLLLSTETEVRDRIRGLRTGADEYVGKPYEAGYLTARANELVRGRDPFGAADPRATVLVIDDSPTFREALRVALVDAGYDVVVAGSGEEGLRVAAHRRPVAIMVDGVLPGIDGATVIRRVRLDAALRAVPCLLITASLGPGAELRALDAGADAFVRKEEDVAVVVAKLAAVLRRAGAASPVDEGRSVLGPKKILAVDDSATYLHALGETLRSEGYDVTFARSGDEALELLAVESVDGILLDLIMPGLSGEDTCRRIKAVPTVRDVPLLILTSKDDREAMLHGLNLGADDYVSKSSDFEILKARLRAQIRRRHFEDEIRRAREALIRRELEAQEARAARDIAEARASLVDEVERKNRELEAFSYSVSHDLRAPLRSVDGFSQALLDDYGDKLDATGRDYLKRVRGAAQRMGLLIDDLLKLARVARADLRPVALDLSELAQRVLSGLHERHPERLVHTDVQGGLWALADSRLIEVALENLLGNAWKFTAKASEARIRFGAEEHESGRAYFVADNGAGFDMTYATRLFSPFQRLHTEAEFPGTGIGLATVQRIIDRHGGRVWADAAVGRGATMRFTIAGGAPG